MATTLVVLAATMGNRYGGLKQLEGIGPNGETILDYSVYDAVKVGFDRIVFVISKYFEKDFKEKVSDKYKDIVNVEHVYQEVDLVPEDKRNSKRALLWGSAHAVLMGKPFINEPFGVINAVNFYQRESFEMLYAQLHKLPNEDFQCFMISYRLANVIPESGGVTRGICEVNDKEELISVVDHHGVERIGGRAMFLNDYNKWTELNDDDLVSMNMWGFTPDIFEYLQARFEVFIHTKGMDMKAHFSIPDFINEMIVGGLCVKSFETSSKWMGLVSPDDRIQVILCIGEMIRGGIYPNKLFEPNLVNDK
ncbi:MAG: hypothetical protein RR220_04405 [Bacteroidaceae bacterium]